MRTAFAHPTGLLLEEELDRLVAEALELTLLILAEEPRRFRAAALR